MFSCVLFNNKADLAVTAHSPDQHNPAALAFRHEQNQFSPARLSGHGPIPEEFSININSLALLPAVCCEMLF
jgi:hypothetical protein